MWLGLVWLFHGLFKSRNSYLSIMGNFLFYFFNNFLPSVFSVLSLKKLYWMLYLPFHPPGFISVTSYFPSVYFLEDFLNFSFNPSIELFISAVIFFTGL